MFCYIYSSLTESRMLKGSSAVVSREAQRAIPSSRAKQSAKAMPASMKPSRSGQGWNALLSVVMAKVMGSPLSRKANGRPHGKPQAMLGMPSGSTMATGNSWMPAGGLEVSLGRATTSISVRTNSQQATRCSGTSYYFLSYSSLFQHTSKKQEQPCPGGKGLSTPIGSTKEGLLQQTPFRCITK